MLNSGAKLRQKFYIVFIFNFLAKNLNLTDFFEKDHITGRISRKIWKK